MSFGDDDAMRKIDPEVERLSELLGLSENQQAVVLEALLGKFNEKKTARVDHDWTGQHRGPDRFG